MAIGGAARGTHEIPDGRPVAALALYGRDAREGSADDFSKGLAMTEKQIKQKTLAVFKKRWPNAFVVKLSDMWISGLPDILFIYRGVVVFIELKVPGQDARPLQRFILNKIKENMIPATVAHSADEAAEFVRCRLYEKGVF